MQVVRRLIGFLLVFTLCLAPTFASDLASTIDNLIAEQDPNTNIGIAIYDLSDDKLLYAKNAERSFIPASNLKLFTATAALLQLKPTYRFHTSLFRDGKLQKNGVLNGNIYLKFSGAPDLTHQDLHELISNLKASHIKSVNGTLYVDASSLDQEKLGPGWMWDDSPYCFGASISPIIVDHNCFEANITGKQRLRVTTPNRNIQLRSNNLQYSNDPLCSLQVSNTKNTYTLSGCISPESQQIDLALDNMPSYIKQELQQTLKSLGIRVKRGIGFTATPATAVLIARKSSAPVSQLVFTMLKESDNLYAEILFKTIGHEFSQGVGTWASGAKALKAIYEKNTSVTLSNSSIRDGSGLSRYNLVTPAAILSLLRYNYQQFEFAADFVAGLPIAGEDGTLHSRFRDGEPHSNIRAKTGSMAHVTGLSGYIETKNNHVVAFSILINSIPHSLKPYRRLEESIVLAIANMAHEKSFSKH